jgi:hypothetical protein
MNIDRMFDEFSAAAKAISRGVSLRDKLRQIGDSEARNCGNCSKWMTRDCKPERERGQFKSCNSSACAEFDRSGEAIRLEAEFRRELAQI